MGMRCISSAFQSAVGRWSFIGRCRLYCIVIVFSAVARERGVGLDDRRGRRWDFREPIRYVPRRVVQVGVQVSLRKGAVRENFSSERTIEREKRRTHGQTSFPRQIRVGDESASRCRGLTYGSLSNECESHASRAIHASVSSCAHL